MPDVDSDFEQARKGMVHEYLVEKYGADKVTAVGTILTFGIKLAVKEVCRYYRVPIKDANRLTSIIDDLEEMAVDGDWKACIKDLDDDDRDFVNGYLAQFPDLFAKAERMVGLARSYGKHAAGYVVSPEPLAKILPIRKSSNDEIITQFDKNIVERLGFLKADVLGLRNLTTFRLAAETIKERHGVDIDFYRLKEDPNDTAVWDIFKRGKNLSIFQMDGNGITAVGMELQPHSIDELSTIVALYRPGVIHAKMPDGTGMLEEYIARAHGEKPVVYLHPMLEPILKDTYAVLVFQEQVMRIFTDLAGFTDEEADNIRAAIGKKKIDKMEKAKPHYLQGCAENGIDHATALQIWDQIEVSSSYLFNKAHSLSYATITFWSAWLKAHYFVEYYTACMSTVPFDKAVAYMQEARRAGVEIVPPVLSSLSADYSVVSDKEIAFGLENVKGVGHQAVASILENAPYETFEDFVDRSGVNRSVVEVMIRAGVFREVYPNRRDLLERYRCGDFRDNLFGAALDLENRVGEETPDYTPEELMEVETELLGMPLTVDPFEPYRAKLGTWAAMMETLDEAAMAGFNTPHLFLVRVDGVKLHQTKRGPMAFVSFQTDGGEPFECTVFSDMWQASQQFVKVGSYLRIEVMKTQYKGGASYVLNRVQPL